MSLSALHRREDGFTLLEVLIVIVLLGIMVTISLPALLGHSNKAWDSMARQHLGLAYKEAGAAQDADNNFPDPTSLAREITASEPGLSVGTALSTSVATTGTVFIIVSTGGNLLLAERSRSGLVWTLQVTGHGSPVWSHS